MPQTLQLGHSPDPDDAFMFYGLAQNPPLLDTKGYRFQHVLQDIQTLNQRARKGDLEITAISIHAYPYVADKYALTSCGSSMGDKYGPMIVAARPMAISDLKGKTIAIPGKLTTAFLALQLWIGKGSEVRTQGSGNAGGAIGQRGSGEGRSRQDDAPQATDNEQLETSLSNPEPRILNPTFSFVVVPFDQILNYVKARKADAG